MKIINNRFSYVWHTEKNNNKFFICTLLKNNEFLCATLYNNNNDNKFYIWSTV